MRKILSIFVMLALLLSTVNIVSGLQLPGGGEGQQIPRPPTADAGGPYSGYLGSPIYFDGSGSSDPNDDIVSYYWDFGDGSTGSGKYPSHTYDETDAYTVTLTVTDSSDYSDTDTTTATVTYDYPEVTVTADPNPTWPGGSGWAWTDITATVSGGVPNYHYLFDFTEGYGQHTGPETSWTMSTGWDTPGFYTVYVTVTDANGYSDTGSVEVDVLDCYFEVDASGPYFGHPDTLVEFSGIFDEDPNCWYPASWDFGDGETGSGKDETHAYTSDGTYDVTLDVNKNCPGEGTCSGSDSTTSTIKTLDIEVDGPDDAPALTEVTYNINVINAFGSQVHYQISYGDGQSDSFYDDATTAATHVYNTEGSHTVQVTATDRIDTTPPYHNAQIIGTHSIQITPAGLYPDAGGPYEAFEDEEIQFDGSGSYTTNGYPIVSYEWDFGDGSTGTGCYATHTYDTYGDYDVTLTITNSNGDSASDSTTSTIMEAYSGLVADAGKPYVGRVGQSVQFDASNSNDAHYYEWDFGDGKTGAGEKPTHVYTAPGEYTVKLTAKRWFGILNRVIDLTTVTVYPSDETLPTDYAYGGCYYEADQNEPITFDSYSQGNFVEYIWDFGDGNTATGETVTHSYENKGSYLVTLTTKDQQGNTFEDVLHADIEQPLTGLLDFLTTFGISVGDIFLDDLYIYTKLYDPITGQTYEKHTLFSNPAEVDVNDDGRNDIRIEKGSPQIGIDKSHFSNLYAMVFKDYYTVNKLSDTITSDSDFEVSIHFSIADWIMNKISGDVEDDFFKIGYHSPSGEEMPSKFTLKHTLIPYLIRRLFNIQPDKTYPEFWSETDVTSTGDSLDLLAGYYKGTPQNIVESRTLTTHYEPAVASIMHQRRGKYKGTWIREFGFSRTETSLLKFTFSKTTQQSTSNVSFLIDRPVDMSFQLKITPLVAGGGIVEYHSSQLLDMILFAESYDEEEHKTTYFYVRNLPTDIVVEWDPRPKGGYIDATTTTYKDLDIGLTDSLDEDIATWKISVSNLPENIHLEWDISIAGQISLLTQNTGALALDYFGWNRDKGLTINFHVDTEEDIDVAAAWDLEAGWFKLTRSITLINFRFTVFQEGSRFSEDMTIEINGYISVSPGQEGLLVDFSTFKDGLITISRGDSNIAFSAGAIIKQGDPHNPSLTVGVETVTISAGAGETEILIQWDDTPMFRVDVSAGGGIGFDLQNFSMDNTQTGFNMAIGSITSNVGANGQGYAEISWDESQSKLGIGGGGSGGALLQVNDFSTNVPSIGLDMEIGVFEIGGSASANLYLKDNGFDLTAEAHVTLQTLNLESSDIILQLGGFSLGGSGTAYVKSGTGGRLEISGSAGLTVGNVYLEAVGTGGTIEIQGQLDITLGGTFILYRDHFELDGSSQLNLNNNGNNVLFIVNGENIEIMGSFALTAQGTIYVYWSETNLKVAGEGGALTVVDFSILYGTLDASASNIQLSASGDISLTGSSNTFVVDVSGGTSVDVAVLDFKIEINQQNFQVLSDNIHVGFDGAFTVEWDTQNTEIWIDAGGTAAFGFDNLAITYGTSVDLSILGSLDFALDGFLHLKPGFVEITATGTVDWGTTACVFSFNGDTMTIGGTFTLTGGQGSITIIGSGSNFKIDVEGGPSLQVDNLEFSAEMEIEGENLDVTADSIYMGANGEFLVEWNGETKDLWINEGSSGSFSFGLSNLDIVYGPVANPSIAINIDGSLDFDVDGWLHLRPGLVELSATGTIDWGVGSTFIFNGETMTIGGTFTLSGGQGVITVSATSTTFDVSVTGGPSLDITGLVFTAEIESEDFSVTSDQIYMGANGEFSVQWDGNTKDLWINEGSTGSFSFGLTNLDIVYGPIANPSIDISIQGSIDFDVQGWLHLQPGFVELTASGTVDWGGGCTFIFNQDTMTVGGQFVLTGGQGIITISATSTTFDVSVTGGPSLDITNLAFTAEIEGEDLSVTSDQIYMGIDGEFSVEWDGATQDLWINAGSSGSFSFGLSNLNIAYSTSIDVSIQGSIDFNVEGWLHLQPNLLEISAIGTVDWGTSCIFTFNSETMTIGGEFILSGGQGVITITGDSTDFSIDVTGGPSLTINNLYFDSYPWNISATSVNLGVNGNFGIHLEKLSPDYKFSINGDISFIIADTSIKYENQEIFTADLLGIGGGGFFDVTGSTAFDIKFDFNGYLDVNALNFEPADSWNWKLDYITVGSFDLDGDASVNVKRTLSGKFSIAGDASLLGTLADLDVYAPYYSSSYPEFDLDIGSFTVDGNVSAELGSINNEPRFQFHADGSASLSNFNFDYKKWSAEIGQVTGSGNLDIDILSTNKWYEIEGDASFFVDDLHIEYNSYNEYDIDFSIDYASIQGAGEIDYNFRCDSGRPKFDIDADVSADLDNLHLAVGAGSSNAIDVTIPNFDLTGNGKLDVEWETGYIDLDATVDIEWTTTIQTSSYGDWTVNGNIDGDVTMIADWDTGSSGEIDLTINEPGILHSLEIIHDDLTLELGTLNLDPGTITFKWQRGNNGYFNILNSGVNADMQLCEVTYKEPQDPNYFNLQLGSFDLISGNTYIDWNKGANSGYIHVNNDVTIYMNLLQVTWGTKTATLGELGLSTGEFKFSWDTANKYVKIRNGISNFGASCSYEDDTRELKLSVFEFESNYNKIITFGWYEESGSITGISLDTDEEQLAEWIEFTSIKGTTGRKIRIYGLEANNFYIKKVGTKLEWGGNLYIANHLIYSRLVNLQTDTWEDLDVQWDLQSDLKYIKFDSDFIITINLISVEILGVTINSDFILTDYFEFKWDIGLSGDVYLDTNGQPIATITFDIWYDTAQWEPLWGIYITASSLSADDWHLWWTAWPPANWNIDSSGTLTWGSIDIDVEWQEDRRTLPV